MIRRGPGDSGRPGIVDYDVHDSGAASAVLRFAQGEIGPRPDRKQRAMLQYRLAPPPDAGTTLPQRNAVRKALSWWLQRCLPHRRAGGSR
jgi:hypothetical protein